MKAFCSQVGGKPSQTQGTINFIILILLFAVGVQSGKHYKDHHTQCLPPELEQKGNSLQLNL